VFIQQRRIRNLGRLGTIIPRDAEKGVYFARFAAWRDNRFPRDATNSQAFMHL
jgi:hypothetical protein